MKLLFILSILWSVTVNAQDQFAPYKSWKIGDSTMVINAKWFAKKNMASAVAIPKENQYWTATRIIVLATPVIDYKAKFDSVSLEFSIFRSRISLEIEALLRTIDSLSQISPPTSNGPTIRKLKYEFDLPKDATVSAGIYKGETLIKTLFSNKKYTAGKHIETIPYDSTQGISVKVLSNNMTYQWDGVIGNTSDSMTGSSIHHGMSQIYAAVPYGDKLFISKLYGEKRLVQNVLNLESIQQNKKILLSRSGGSQSTTHIATDGVNVYWAGGDAYRNWNTWVFATPFNNTDVETIFQYGIPHQGYGMPLYKSVIAFNKDSVTFTQVTGLAVQQRGRLLFTARGKLNSISVDDKTTGLHIRDISITSPNGLSIDDNDNLVVAAGTSVNRYSVSPTGQIELLTAIPGFERPLAVSAKKNLILVADAGGSNQIKAYDTIGNHLWTKGDYGGQEISASVSYDRFSLPNNASVSIQDDGSFWFADIGNNRLLHFNSDRTIKEEIQYIPHNYNCWVDPNDPTNIYSDWFQFKVDYDEPDIRKSWKLVANWGFQMDTVIRKGYANGMKPILFSNGKRYGFHTYRVPNITKIKYENRLFEYQADGLVRYTGIIVNHLTPISIAPNGDIHGSPIYQAGISTKWQKFPLVGYNGDNPVWGPIQTLATVNTPRWDDPVGYPPNAGDITSDGTMIKYDHSTQTAYNYHLAGIKIGDTAYRWRTSLSTGLNYAGIYPPNGAHDDGNNVVNAGNMAAVIDSIIITGYKGEFWKSSQTNMYNVFHQSGLMLGQFGVVGPDAEYECFPGMAGNVFYINLIKHEDEYFMWHNDEGHHSGLHRWRISNQKSIKLLNIVPTVINVPIDTNVVDLMAGIPYDVVLNDSIAGWNRFPKTENYTDQGVNMWKVMTYTRSYERDVPDVAVTYAAKRVVDSSFITRELGNNNSKSWSLSGKISIGGSYNSINTFNQYDSLATGCYVEILDNNNQPIFRLFSQQNKERTGVNTNLNGNRIWVDEVNTFTDLVRNFNDIDIRCSDGIITLNYMGRTATAKATGNVNQPNKFRLYFFAKGGRLNRFISIKELIFTK